MFKKLVSNLPNKPSSIRQLDAYSNRLHQERKINLIILLLAVVLFGIQLLAAVTPAKHGLNSSINDLIYGGNGATNRGIMDAYQLNRDSLGRTDIRELFNYYNINDVDITTSDIDYINLGDETYAIVGRVPRGQKDEATLPLTNSSPPLYIRSTDSRWKNSSPKPALKVMSEKGINWVLLESGDIITKNTDKASRVINQCTETDMTSCLVQKNTVKNITQDIFAGNSTTASAGDTIEYTLSIENTSNTLAVPNTNIQINIEDILEYADIFDASGATYADLPVRTITWETGNLSPGQEESRSMLIKVKSPLPTTVASMTDPYSYDARIINHYGNITEVTLAQPVVKVIEQAITKLPNLSSNVNLLLSSLFVCAAFFFYYRSKLFSIEVDLILAHMAKGHSK